MPTKQLDRVIILNVTIIVEAVMLLTATFWAQIAEVDLLPAFRCHHRFIVLGTVAGLVTACSGFFMLWMAQHYGNKIKWLDTLNKIVLDDVAPLFAQFNLGDIFLVAAASGFCEEVFFRGVVQEQSSLFTASMAFGIFHCPSLRHLPYGIWAVAAGLMLGLLKEYTGSIWTPIVAHSLNNLIVLIFLRYGLNESVKTPT